MRAIQWSFQGAETYDGRPVIATYAIRVDVATGWRQGDGGAAFLGYIFLATCCCTVATQITILVRQ